MMCLFSFTTLIINIIPIITIFLVCCNQSNSGVAIVPVLATDISSCGTYTHLTGVVTIKANISAPCPELIIADSSSTLTKVIIEGQHSINKMIIRNIECHQNTDSCIYFNGTFSSINQIVIESITHFINPLSQVFSLKVVRFDAVVTGSDEMTTNSISISDLRLTSTSNSTELAFSSTPDGGLNGVLFSTGTFQNFDSISISNVVIEDFSIRTAIYQRVLIQGVCIKATFVGPPSSSSSSLVSITNVAIRRLHLTSENEAIVVRGLVQYSSISGFSHILISGFCQSHIEAVSQRKNVIFQNLLFELLPENYLLNHQDGVMLASQIPTLLNISNVTQRDLIVRSHADHDVIGVIVTTSPYLWSVSTTLRFHNLVQHSISAQASWGDSGLTVLRIDAVANTENNNNNNKFPSFIASFVRQSQILSVGYWRSAAWALYFGGYGALQFDEFLQVQDLTQESISLNSSWTVFLLGLHTETLLQSSSSSNSSSSSSFSALLLKRLSQRNVSTMGIYSDVFPSVAVLYFSESVVDFRRIVVNDVSQKFTQLCSKSRSRDTRMSVTGLTFGDAVIGVANMTLNNFTMEDFASTCSMINTSLRMYVVWIDSVFAHTASDSLSVLEVSDLSQRRVHVEAQRVRVKLAEWANSSSTISVGGFCSISFTNLVQEFIDAVALSNSARVFGLAISGSVIGADSNFISSPPTSPGIFSVANCVQHNINVKASSEALAIFFQHSELSLFANFLSYNLTQRNFTIFSAGGDARSVLVTSTAVEGIHNVSLINISDTSQQNLTLSSINIRRPDSPKLVAVSSITYLSNSVPRFSFGHSIIEDVLVLNGRVVAVSHVQTALVDNNSSLEVHSCLLRNVRVNPNISPTLVIAAFAVNPAGSIGVGTLRFATFVRVSITNVSILSLPTRCSTSACSLVSSPLDVPRAFTGWWTISNVSIRTVSAVFSSLRPWKVFAPTSHVVLENNFVEIDDRMFFSVSSFFIRSAATLSTSTWIIKCNRWPAAVTRNFQRIAQDTSIPANDPTVEVEKCQESPSVSSSLSSTYELSLTRSNSSSRTKSLSPIVLPPKLIKSSFDSSLARTSDVAAGTAATSAAIASLVTASPALLFGVARQQAVVNFLQDVRDGNCGIVQAVDSVSFADSPTGLAIGDSEARFYVGGIVGNFVLTLCLLVATVVLGFLYLKFVRKSSSWNNPLAVFARSNVALTGFVCSSLLLSSTMKFSLVALTIPEVSFTQKVLAAVLGIVLFAVPSYYYAIWCIFLRTSESKKTEEFIPCNEKDFESESELKSKSVLSKCVSFWFATQGEWICNTTRTTLDQRLRYKIASPMIEGYIGRTKWFGLVEFVSMLGLALAPVVGSFVPAEKSCLTVSLVLIVPLGVLLLLCLFYRPFQELFYRIFVPLIIAIEIVAIGIGYVLVQDAANDSTVSALALIVVFMQMAMSLVVLLHNAAPLFEMLKTTVWNRIFPSPTDKGRRRPTHHHHHPSHSPSSSSRRRHFHHHHHHPPSPGRGGTASMKSSGSIFGRNTIPSSLDDLMLLDEGGFAEGGEEMLIVSRTPRSHQSAQSTIDLHHRQRVASPPSSSRYSYRNGGQNTLVWDSHRNTLQRHRHRMNDNVDSASSPSPPSRSPQAKRSQRHSVSPTMSRNTHIRNIEDRHNTRHGRGDGSNAKSNKNSTISQFRIPPQEHERL